MSAYSSTVNIEIFNIGTLSISGTPVPHMERRFPAIVRSYLNTDTVADIICFTEVHEREHRTALIDALSRSHTYAIFFDDCMGSRKNNGLLLLSRFPLSEPGFISCANTAVKSQAYCGRGVLYAHVHLSQEKKFRLLCTSIVRDDFTHSEDQNEFEHALTEQLDTVLSAAQMGMSDHVILGGFNCDPHSSEDLQLYMLENGYTDVYAAVHAHQDIKPSRHNWDPQNPLNVLSSHHVLHPQCIDHAFVSMSSRIVPRKARITRSDACVPTPDGLMPLSDQYALHIQLSL